MSPRTLKLNWPKSKPTDAELLDVMGLREFDGHFNTQNGLTHVYSTRTWDDSRKEAEALITMLPKQYKRFWNQLNYTSVYHQEVYSWLTRWLEGGHEASSMLIATIGEVLEFNSKYISYLEDVKDRIWDEVQDVDQESYDQTTRIPVFDEWIIKDHFELHQATKKDLGSRDNKARFDLDPFKNADSFVLSEEVFAELVCPDELPDMRFGISHFNFDEYMQKTLKELGHLEETNADQGKGRGEGKGTGTGTGTGKGKGKGKGRGRGRGDGKGTGKGKKKEEVKRKRPIIEDSEEEGLGKEKKGKKGKTGVSSKRSRRMVEDSEDEGDSADSTEQERKNEHEISAHGGGLAVEKPMDKEEENGTTSREVVPRHDNAARLCGFDEGIAGEITQALGEYFSQQRDNLDANSSLGSAFAEAEGDMNRNQVSEALSSPGIGHISLREDNSLAPDEAEFLSSWLGGDPRR